MPDRVLAVSAGDRGVPVRQRWDVVLGIALTVVLLGVATTAAVLGALLTFASDPCGGTTACAVDRLSAGVLTAMIGPAVVAVVAVVALVERLVRARRTFWVPLVGIAAVAAVWAVGAVLVFTAVPSS